MREGVRSRLFIFLYQYFMYRFLFDTYYGLYFFGFGEHVGGSGFWLGLLSLFDVACC